MFVFFKFLQTIVWFKNVLNSFTKCLNRKSNNDCWFLFSTVVKLANLDLFLGPCRWDALSRHFHLDRLGTQHMKCAVLEQKTKGTHQHHHHHYQHNNPLSETKQRKLEEKHSQMVITRFILLSHMDHNDKIQIFIFNFLKIILYFLETHFGMHI